MFRRWSYVSSRMFKLNRIQMKMSQPLSGSPVPQTVHQLAYRPLFRVTFRVGACNLPAPHTE